MINQPKIAVFVDAGNLWSSYKTLGKVLDLQKLGNFFETQFQGLVFKVFYYVAYPDQGTRPKHELDKHHKFLTFLKRGLHFSVVTKPLKTIHLRNPDGKLIYDQATGRPESIEKGNFDVELTIDAMRHATEYDIAVLMTGDSDFLSLVTYLRTLNCPKRVYIFSTEGSVSQELRTGGDGYFDLANCSEIHGKDLVFKKDKK